MRNDATNLAGEDPGCQDCRPDSRNKKAEPQRGPHIRPGTLLAPVLTLIVLLGAVDSAHVQAFEPTFSVEFADPAAGANSDFTSEFNLPQGNVNFTALAAFIPGYREIVSGDEIPLGAVRR